MSHGWKKTLLTSEAQGLRVLEGLSKWAQHFGFSMRGSPCDFPQPLAPIGTVSPWSSKRAFAVIESSRARRDAMSPVGSGSSQATMG